VSWHFVDTSMTRPTITIYEVNTVQVIKYRTDNGSRTALLIKSGRKFHHIMPMDLPIRIRKVAKAEERYFTELDYPLARAKRIFRDSARASYQGNLKNAPKSVREALR
jgi:hypothetical protein